MSNSKATEKTVVSATRSATRLKKRPRLAKQLYERFNGDELTDDMLREAVQLFNENYGIWGDFPESGRKPGIPG